MPHPALKLLLAILLLCYSFSANSQAEVSEEGFHFIYKTGRFYFVSAPSGLNYRQSPKGEILGKFKLNQLVKLVEITDTKGEVSEWGKALKGKWLGVEHEKDTVYVFSAFVSESYTYSGIKFFYARAYRETEKGPKPGFVNLTELFYQKNEYPEEPMTEYEGIGSDPIRYNTRQTNTFLRSLGLSRKDTLYIFNIIEDRIFKYPLSGLQASAYEDVYGSGLEYGLNLEKKYETLGYNFAYIGRTNPFQTGKVKQMVWQLADSADFPVASLQLDNIAKLETYRLSHEQYHYYLQSHWKQMKNRTWLQTHHIAIVDTLAEELVAEWNYSSSESIYLNSADTVEIERPYTSGYAWTGAFIKDKPMVFIGLYNNGFACPSVRFVDKNEPMIAILCDARH